MAIALVAAAANLEAVIESITPPSDPERTYRKLEGKTPREGVRGHRVFRFGPPSADLPFEQGALNTVFRHTFELRMGYSARGKTYDGLFQAVATEAVLICNTVNTWAIAWGAGVTELRIENYRREDIGGEDLEIVFDVIAECEESDGY